jgi:hypothetical protein
MPRLSRLGPLRWLALFDLARTAWSHFDEHLAPKDRSRLAEIVRRTRGDVRRLTPRDRDDLRAIARRLELARLGRDLLPHVGRARRGRR